MEFLKWYKNKVEQSKLEPPEFIWEKIQDDLDINQSWGAINKHLSQQFYTRGIRNISIAASLLVLISLGTFWYLNQDIKQREFQTLVEDVNEAENKIIDVDFDKPEELITENTPDVSSEIKPQKNSNKQLILTENSNHVKVYTDTNKIKFNEENITHELILAKLYNKEISIKKNNDNLLAEVVFPEHENQQVENKERVAFRKLYIGSTGQLANTWLLNDKTYTGLENSSLITSNASFGTNLGLFIGTNITKLIDLQLDLNVFVQNNQSYNEYLNGHYIENKMKFNYSQAALSMRYYLISKKFLQGEHGINIGGYLAYLHNAYQSINNETTNLTSNYNTMDYGVFLSYEYVIPIYKQLGLGTGFRAYYGLRNIYSGDEYIPAYLNETKNASINLSISLKYSIK